MTQVQWTKEAPTEVGWYWLKTSWPKDARIECVEIYRKSTILSVRYGWPLYAAIYIDAWWAKADVPEPPQVTP
jgi:hypothetical protein